jgi:RimJ/RimL family protein N-acetyltransferase
MACLAQQVNSLKSQLLLKSAIGDSLLATAYLRFEIEGQLHHIYHRSVPSLREFLDYHLNPRNVWLACMIRPILDNGEPDETRIALAGLGWINTITDVTPDGKYKKAEVGMAFFREYQKRGIAGEFTEMLTDYAFDIPGVEALFGTTPEPNRAALIFGRRMGFTQLPPLPLYTCWEGKPCAAIVSYLTKDSWMNRR